MSGFDTKLTITGIQQAQAAALKVAAAVKPQGTLGRAVKSVTLGAHRGAVARTHVLTGSLRASHVVELETGAMRGHVFINPTTINPRTGQRPSDYGPYEHARGGSHAFYERTVDEDGDRLLQMAGRELEAGLP